MDNLPRLHDPARNYCRDDNSTSDVEVLGPKTHDVVGTADDIGRKIGTNLGYYPAEPYKEGASPTRGAVPVRSNFERIPDVLEHVSREPNCGRRCVYLSINNLGSRAADDAEESQHELDAWQKGNLPVDTPVCFEIPCEVGYVGRHCCPAAGDGGQRRQDQP